MRCVSCGKFFRMQPGCAWRVVYTGHPPEPHEEIFMCKPCVDAHGPFTPQHGIKPEASCGMVK